MQYDLATYMEQYNRDQRSDDEDEGEDDEDAGTERGTSDAGTSVAPPNGKMAALSVDG